MISKPHDNGLRVIIVGAGFCGMTAAIECRQRGMHPILIENYPTSRTQGDVIDFFANGGRIIQSWKNGEIAKKLLAMGINNNDKFKFFNAKGEFLCTDAWLQEPHHYNMQFAGHRGEMHQCFIDYAEEIGVEFRFGEKVVDYLDSKEELGVVTAKGEKILGDVVLAADGPRSLARQKILGLPDERTNSGYAIYRGFYDLTDEHRNDPLMETFTNPDKDFTGMWVGKDLHGLVYCWNKGRDLGWVLTHKDDHDIKESWSFPGATEDVIAYLDEGGFEERFKQVVRYSPPGGIVDFKLVWREPLKTWKAKTGRAIVIGDAAHTHLPTSGQGASQSMEDGAVIAICLKRANGDIPLALEVFQRIRFNRQLAIQMSSVANRDEYHNVEWTPEFIKEHPKALEMRRPEWILEFDVKADAEEHFERLAQEVMSKKPGALQQLAVPAGGCIMAIKPGDTEATPMEIPVL